MRQLIFSLFFCAFALGVNAQNIAEVFTSMPDQYIPQLEHAWRQDLVDLYKSGKEARLKNTMNGFSVLRNLTNDYLLLETTERSSVEMKLLPLVNNTYVVCMITTVNGPVPDSRINFFSTTWEALKTSDLFTAPTGKWYLKENANKDDYAYQEALSLLDMDLIQYQLNPENRTLTMLYTTPQYLNEESQKKVAPFLNSPKVFSWEKYHFLECKNDTLK